jgi:DNA-binding PadR family transcriptional regulator
MKCIKRLSNVASSRPLASRFPIDTLYVADYHSYRIPIGDVSCTLVLLILKSLVAGEMHESGISRRVQQITGGTFVIKPGSLVPALHRMEEEGWISSFWGDSENNRRAKFYRLKRGWTKATRSRNQAMGPRFVGHRSSIGNVVERHLTCRSL